MSAEHRFACGVPSRQGEVSLNIQKGRGGIQLNAEEFVDSYGGAVSRRVRDLLDIAVFVATADQMTSRGDGDENDVGASWRRRLSLRIAVRDPDFWRSHDTTHLLTSVLSFVSEDVFSFSFSQSKRRVATSVSPDVASMFRDTRIIAFSGGLDSLAGACEAVLGERKSAALITIGSSTKLLPMQARLAAELDSAARSASTGAKVYHSTLRFQRHVHDTERTQRTRSFVVAAAGLVAAAAISSEDLYFYENGVISLNLPISHQSLGARSTRTTHPATLAGYAGLFSHVLGRSFKVENPFLWRTKSEVIGKILQYGLGRAIGSSVSCGSVIRMTKAAPHCGTCSQCLDRRIAMFAAGAHDCDPSAGYRSDPFTTTRTVEDLTLAEGYIRRARELSRINEMEFVRKYPELSRIVSHLPHSTAESTGKIFELHQRHANQVVAGASLGLGLMTGAAEPRSLASLLQPRLISGAPASRRDCVTVVHVSDIHFAPKSIEQDHVLDLLAKDLRTLRETERVVPDLVLVTGDIVNRGSVTEMARAERWLGEKLLPAADVGMERLVLVPGNHDVDRSAVNAVMRNFREGLLDTEDHSLLTALLSHPQQRQMAVGPLAAFVALATKFDDRRKGSDAPWVRAEVQIGSRRVHVAGLSTACFAYDKRDRGNLVVGIQQTLEVLDTDRRADLAIVAFHHPLTELAEFDERRLKPLILENCDLVLTGHVHQNDTVIQGRPDGETVWIGGGAAYAGHEYSNRYHIVEWNFEAKEVRVFSRHWDGARWAEDKNAYGGATAAGYSSVPMPKRRGAA